MTCTVTPQQVYQALIGVGFSTTQAIGIMANAVFESSLNPEAVNPGGLTAGGGLLQWESTYYPGITSLVTGNCTADLAGQAKYAGMTIPQSALAGGTAAAVAGAVAANFEKCSSCQPGGSQYNSRVAQAATVAGWVSSGNWPTSVGSGTAGAANATLTSASSSPACLLSNPFSTSLPLIGNISAGPSCIFTKPNARAYIGFVLMANAVLIGLVGTGILAYALGQRTGITQAAGNVAGTAGEVAGAAVSLAGAPEIGAPLAVAGSGVKRVTGGSQGRAGAYAARKRTQSRAARQVQPGTGQQGTSGTPAVQAAPKNAGAPAGRSGSPRARQAKTNRAASSAKRRTTPQGGTP
jgi:hypothetical protein